MVCKIIHTKDKSRRDNTLITAGFNLRQESNAPQVPQGRHLGIDNVPSLRDLDLVGNSRRLKPTVNKVPSLRDLVGRLVRYRRLKPTVSNVPSLQDLIYTF